MNDKQNTFLLIHIPTGRRLLFNISLLNHNALTNMCHSCLCHGALYDGGSRPDKLAVCRSTSCPAYPTGGWHDTAAIPVLLDFVRPEFLAMFLVYIMDPAGDLRVMEADGFVRLTFRECSGSDFLHAFPWYGQLSQEAIQDYICNSVIPNEFK